MILTQSGSELERKVATCLGFGITAYQGTTVLDQELVLPLSKPSEKISFTR